MPERTSIRSMWNKCPQQQKTTQFMSLVNKTSRSISSVQIMVFYEVISFIKVKEIRIKCIWHPKMINPLNAELNPICHLLPLLWAHHILHVSRIRVKWKKNHTVPSLKMLDQWVLRLARVFQTLVSPSEAWCTVHEGLRLDSSQTIPDSDNVIHL